MMGLMRTMEQQVAARRITCLWQLQLISSLIEEKWQLEAVWYFTSLRVLRKIVISINIVNITISQFHSLHGGLELQLGYCQLYIRGGRAEVQRSCLGFHGLVKVDPPAAQHKPDQGAHG